MHSNKRQFTRAILLAIFAASLASCATVQPTAFAVGPRRAPKPAAAVITLFMEAPPARKFTVVAHLNLHVEKTFFIASAFPENRGQLENLARQAGADALIDIQEKKSRLNETFIYNVTATAIVFDE